MRRGNARFPGIVAFGLCATLAASSVRAQRRPVPELPPDYSAQLTRADQLLAAHRPQQALQLYEVATQGRAAAVAYAGEGRALLALGRTREAVGAWRAAVVRERDGPRRAEYLIALGDACLAAADRVCAADAYLWVLRERPSATASERYRALGQDAFAQAYPFGPGQPTATDRLPRATPGLTLSLGSGMQYAGELGAQVGYDLRAVDGARGITPYVSVGMLFGRTHTPFAPLPAVGVMASFGRRSRWLTDLSLGGIGVKPLEIYGTTVAWRRVYALSASVGGETGLTRSLFLRLLIGFSIPIDRSRRGTMLALSSGIGVKL